MTNKNAYAVIVHQSAWNMLMDEMHVGIFDSPVQASQKLKDDVDEVLESMDIVFSLGRKDIEEIVHLEMDDIFIDSVEVWVSYVIIEFEGEQVFRTRRMEAIKSLIAAIEIEHS